MVEESKGPKSACRKTSFPGFVPRRTCTVISRSKVRDCPPHKLRSSERFLAIHACDHGQLHEGHPLRGQAVTQAERGQPHGAALLPGDLREEPLRGRDQGRDPGKVPDNEGATLRPATRAVILFRLDVHVDALIYEGHHC